MHDDCILVTGAAGFIGHHLCARLLSDGWRVLGVDSLNAYYDVRLKEARLALLNEDRRFSFVKGDIAEEAVIASVIERYRPRFVVNLAAQAGVRYSLEHPEAYVRSNLVGFGRLLEACRNVGVDQLLYASSSSVYGRDHATPFRETDPVEHPASVYAATKRSNELMADCYSHLYGLRCTGLRFFTVYGPYGRPDMAYYNFADRFFADKPIRVFGADGNVELSRDFTYVDDVIESVVRLIGCNGYQGAAHDIYNVGGNDPVRLADFIEILEGALSLALGKTVVFEKIPDTLQPGDMLTTHANTERLFQATGYRPHVSLADGLQSFADWYVKFHGR